MPNIRPVSDLLSELLKSETTAAEKGWLTEEEADAALYDEAKAKDDGCRAASVEFRVKYGM